MHQKQGRLFFGLISAGNHSIICWKQVTVDNTVERPQTGVRAIVFQRFVFSSSTIKGATPERTFMFSEGFSLGQIFPKPPPLFGAWRPLPHSGEIKRWKTIAVPLCALDALS